MRFTPTVVHVPGKHQITADALSRALVDGPDSQDATSVDNVEAFTSQTIDPGQSEKTTGDKRRPEGGCNPTPSHAV